ncbi:MAG TPA: ATP-binding protein [Iamia sp.]|nr:ATP-binding protein [Iamia sp.]
MHERQEMGDPFHPTATPGLVERAAAPAVELLDEAAGRAGVTPLRALLYTGALATAVGGAQIAAGRSLSLGEVALVVLAVLACTAWALAARHQTGRTRVALIVLAAATALWGLGRLAGAIQGTTKGRVEPTIALDDVGVLASALCLLAAVLLLVEGPSRRMTQLRALIEGLMIGGCSLFVAWNGVFGATFTIAEGASAISRTVLIMQPLVQVAIVAVLVSASTRVPPERWDWWIPVATGIGLIVAADVATAHGDTLVSGHGATLGLVGHLAGFGVVLVAAVTSTAPPPSTPRPLRSRPVLTWLPSVAALGILAALLVTDDLEPTRLYIAMSVLGLSVALHLVVILESDELAGDLSTAHDEAIQASISKSRFLATVSHEIRTPMNAVIGLTGLLLDSELDEEQQELAVGVAISAEGLLDLINDLLDFSKIEAQKLDLEEIDLDLEDLIGEVAMIVADGGHKKGLQVIAYCDPAVDHHRKGDPLRLRQILLNLASNAVKFTDKGTVVIRAVPAGSDPDMVAFEVVDTGVGIAEEARSRLFQPFSQADDTITRHYGGTGLGLAIVKNLIDLQGGTINVDSELGVGTCFRVTLPLPKSMQPKVEAGLDALVGLRALVVDNNAVTRTVLSHTLHTWGFVVDQAESAEDALELYARTRGTYALAILEYQLDGMDGVKLGEILRAQDPTASTVMMLLSSDPNVSRRAAHDAGIRSVLVKPVRNTYLLRRIVETVVADPSVPALPPASATPAPASAVLTP